ncbi:MAG TPA: hypothetical protein VHO72_12725 [Bacteroidales bacterium]|nr:hypothetical protein [Bacteroidales bacterium]
MEKQLKVILYIVIAFLVIDLGYDFFFGTRQIKRKIDKIEKQLDGTINDLNKSMMVADSLHQSVQRLRLFINDAQSRAEVLDLERRLNDQDFRNKRDSINRRLTELYKKLNITGKEIRDIDDSISPL